MEERPLLDPEMPSSKRQKTRDLITVRINRDKVITVDREDYRAFSKLTPDIFPKIHVKLGNYNHQIISMNEERRIYDLDIRGSETGFSFNERLPEELWTLSALVFLDLDSTSTGSIPSSIQSLPNLISLSLCHNKINLLPSEIGSLVNLKYLNLGHNDLEGLPPEIGKLTNLREMYLENNNLKCLPPDIGNLENLESLNLDNNNLEALPTEIGNMESLDYLNLEKNKLEDLPSEIGNLSFLAKLIINHNDLKVLPPEIGNLGSLVTLMISHNDLKVLPPEIGNLASLERVWFDDNELEDLPPEIGNLLELDLLVLDDNKLRALPPEIGNLVNLNLLHLFNNELRALPPEIGNLVNMNNLVLGDNDLLELPPEVGNLVNLQTLLLCSNPLISLPPSIGNLSVLKTIYITDTPLQGVPNELWNLSNLRYLDMRWSPIMILPFIERLRNLHILRISTNLTDDEVEFMADFILNTPSLCFIEGSLAEYPNIQYAIACNRFKLRSPFSAGSNQKVLPFLSQLWPRMLANSNQAFEHSKKPSDLRDRVRIEPHDAIYKLLTEGLDSFVQMLYARKPERNIITVKADNKLISIDEDDFKALRSFCPDILQFYSDMLKYFDCEIIQIDEDDEDRRISLLDFWGHDSNYNFGLHLPDELWRLSALESLNLSAVHTGPIPSHIQKLQNLKHLSIDYNHLTHLPPEIGKLVNLDSLDISYNSLTDLPPEIGNLKNLKELNLGQNHFQLLPPCIGSLSNLERFKMADSGYVEVPVEFWNLHKLCSMKMTLTEIVISPSIERLQNLQELNMLLIEALPEEFGNLVSLKRLDLDICEYSCTILFPFSMTPNLQSLEYFRLDSCDCSTKFDVRQLGFLRSLPKLTELCIHIDLTDDGVEFMKNLILDTPSLRVCGGGPYAFRDFPNWYSPKIKYALLHNHFKRRTCLGCGTKDMSALVYKLWPQMLSNASRAFYAKGKVDKRVLSNQHDAVYQLLKKGRGSFVGMLRDRSSSNHK